MQCPIVTQTSGLLNSPKPRVCKKLISKKIILTECDNEINSPHDPTYSKNIALMHKEKEQHHIVSKPIVGTNSVHKEITERMRGILMNWLSAVAIDCQLRSSTFFLGIEYLDTALNVDSTIKKNNFQLLGSACMLLAAKMDEVEVPRVATFVDLSERCFSEFELIAKEAHVLQKILKYQLYVPTRHSWVERFAQCASLNLKEECFLHYLLEMSLYDSSFKTAAASRVTAAALHYTLQSFRPVDSERVLWTPQLAQDTGYVCDSSMRAIVRKLQALHWGVETLGCTKNLLKKYSSLAMYEVALHAPVRAQDLRYDPEPAVSVSVSVSDKERGDAVMMMGLMASPTSVMTVSSESMPLHTQVPCTAAVAAITQPDEVTLTQAPEKEHNSSASSHCAGVAKKNNTKAKTAASSSSSTSLPWSCAVEVLKPQKQKRSRVEDCSDINMNNICCSARRRRHDLLPDVHTTAPTESITNRRSGRYVN